MSSRMVPHSVEVVSSLDPRHGGMSASLPRLAEATAAQARHRVTILVAHHPDNGSAVQMVEGVSVVGSPVRRIDCWNGGWASRSLGGHLAGADVVHIHGLWEPHGVLAARWARRLGKPYLISAHGMVEPWALRNKWWKKRPYWWLVERGNLQRGACLRAVTRSEAEDYRRLGLKTPVAVVPHGVDVPAGMSAALFHERFPALKEHRLILFLGRIHYKKGVDLLCRTWSRVCARHPDAHLVLAGPHPGGTRRSLERLIEELGITSRVTFTGMLEGDLKWSALGAATVFALPSRSEGFSVALLEAMAAGLPVIITRQCHFPEVAQNECGQVIERDGQQLERALEDFLRLPRGEGVRMGLKGQQLVAARYNWETIGRQMVEVYDWVLGGPRPQSVEIL